MILVPAATPDTNPVLLMLATADVAETHALLAAAVPEPVSCVVEPIHVVKPPVMDGAIVIVTVAV